MSPRTRWEAHFSVAIELGGISDGNRSLTVARLGNSRVDSVRVIELGAAVHTGCKPAGR